MLTSDEKISRACRARAEECRGHVGADAGADAGAEAPHRSTACVAASATCIRRGRTRAEVSVRELKCQSSSGVEQRLPRLVNHCFSTGGKADDCSH